MPKMIPTSQKAQPGATTAAVKYAVGSGSRPSNSSKSPIKSSAPARPQKIRG